MSRQGLVTLPPTRLDLAISERCVRAATPARERSLQVMTWLADEKIVLGAVGLFWLHAKLRPRADEVRHEANRMLLSAVVAGLLPHLLKYVVNRRRPDRTLVHGPRHGIPRSGEAWDSFPSGHALHLGAIRVGGPTWPRLHTHHAPCALRERCSFRTGDWRGPRQDRPKID
jgi:membrane-associated phospholipid phosphatase